MKVSQLASALALQAIASTPTFAADDASIGSLFGFTENNFFFKDEHGAKQAVATFVKMNDVWTRTDSATAAVNKDAPTKETSDGGATDADPPKKNKASSTVTAATSTVAFDGCDGIEFKFEVDYVGDISKVRADLYASNESDMNIVYNWSEGFLTRVKSSPYGETICLDGEKDYRLDLLGEG